MTAQTTTSWAIFKKTFSPWAEGFVYSNPSVGELGKQEKSRGVDKTAAELAVMALLHSFTEAHWGR